MCRSLGGKKGSTVGAGDHNVFIWKKNENRQLVTAVLYTKEKQKQLREWSVLAIGCRI